MIKINNSNGESITVETEKILRFIRDDKNSDFFVDNALLNYSFSEVGLLTTEITTSENTIILNHGLGVQISCFGPEYEIFRLVFAILIIREKNLSLI
ncbi:MAG: hypothetical protein WC229_03490 [Candidatus Paceibacterota bacterium]|jgi:hypothetical protein